MEKKEVRFQTLKNFGFITIFVILLLLILQPVKFVDDQTIIRNKEALFVVVVAIAFFEFEFWSGVKRAIGKEPGKFALGFLGWILVFFALQQLAPEVLEFIFQGGILALLVWWLFLGGLLIFTVNKAHPITLGLFIIATIIEFFDPTQTILGGILGVVFSFLFFGSETLINRRPFPAAFTLTFLLSLALIIPSITINIVLIVVMLLHKQFIDIKEKKKVVT